MSRQGERPMVPKADFGSYYGQPVIKTPTGKAPTSRAISSSAGSPRVLGA